MPKKKNFDRPEKPLEQMREIFNEVRISKKAEMKRKFNRNLKLSNILEETNLGYINTALSAGAFSRLPFLNCFLEFTDKLIYLTAREVNSHIIGSFHMFETGSL